MVLSNIGNEEEMLSKKTDWKKNYLAITSHFQITHF